jgi:hypothetical protein
MMLVVNGRSHRQAEKICEDSGTKSPAGRINVKIVERSRRQAEKIEE